MQTGLVDIIIPCYNQAHFLGQAIESALAQTYHPISILVVDDGSTDETRDVAASFSGRVEYVYQNNTGLPGARNAGIRMTQGGYVFCLDSDDVMLPSMIETLVQYMEKHEEIDILHSKALSFNGDNVFHPLAEDWRPYRNWNDWLEPLSFICALCTISTLFRRRVFEQVGLYAEEMAGKCIDWHLWFRSVLAGKVIAYHPEVLALYRQHGASSSGEEGRIAYRESELMMSATRMQTDYDVLNPQRRRMLSCGIKSIATRWLPLGKTDRFRELVRLADQIDPQTPQDGNKPDLFRSPSLFPTSLYYVSLTKSLLDLQQPELAAVMFIKCGDLRPVREEATAAGVSELFDEVLGAMAGIGALKDTSERTCPRGNERIEAIPAGRSGFYHRLERAIPRCTSFYGYVKHQLGVLYKNDGRYEEAEQELKTAVALNPNYVKSRMEITTLLVRRRNYRKAKDHLKAALEIDVDECTQYGIEGINSLIWKQVGSRQFLNSLLSKAIRVSLKTMRYLLTRKGSGNPEAIAGSPLSRQSQCSRRSVSGFRIQRQTGEGQRNHVGKRRDREANTNTGYEDDL